MKKLLLTLAALVALSTTVANAQVLRPAGGCRAGVPCKAGTLAIGGATIAANALAVTGTGAISGTLTLGGATRGLGIASGTTGTSPGYFVSIGSETFGRAGVYADANNIGLIGFGPGSASAFDVFIQRNGAASVRFGTSDVGSGAVAQTITFQGNTGSSTNGPLATIRGAGGGSSTSVGGELRLQGGLSSAAAGTGGAVTIYTAPAAAGTTPAVVATFASTGTVTIPGSIITSNTFQGTSVGAGAANVFFWSGRSALASPVDGAVRIGNTSGTSTADLTVSGASTTGGSVLTLGGGLTTSGTVTMNGLGTDAAAVDSSLCLVTSTKAVVTGTGTLGICLGTSSARYKTNIRPLSPGLAAILQLRPVSYRLDAAHGDPTKLLYGFTAEDMVGPLPALVGLDAEGKPNTADYLGLVPVLVKAVQELKAANDNMARRITELETQHRVFAQR